MERVKAEEEEEEEEEEKEEEEKEVKELTRLFVKARQNAGQEGHGKRASVKNGVGKIVIF